MATPCPMLSAGARSGRRGVLGTGPWPRCSRLSPSVPSRRIVPRPRLPRRWSLETPSPAREPGNKARDSTKLGPSERRTSLRGDVPVGRTPHSGQGSSHELLYLACLRYLRCLRCLRLRCLCLRSRSYRRSRATGELCRLLPAPSCTRQRWNRSGMGAPPRRISTRRPPMPTRGVRCGAGRMGSWPPAY